MPILVCLPLAFAGGDPSSLVLSGDIDLALKYTVAVDFVTTAPDMHCKFEDNITGMWAPVTERRTTPALISGGKHTTTISLTRDGDREDCGWAPSVVRLCVGRRTAENPPISCSPLYLIRPGGAEHPSDLSLLCADQTRLCVQSDGRRPLETVATAAGEVTMSLRVSAD